MSRGTFCLVLGLLLIGSGCEVVDRVRGPAAAVDSTVATESAGSLTLTMQVPGVIRPGVEEVVRISVTNQSDTVARGARLDLLVPAWLEPAPPRPGDPEVNIVADAEEGIRLSYRMDERPLQPGEMHTVEQRIRLSPTGQVAGGTTPWGRAISARLLGEDGRPRAQVESQITLDGVAPGDSSAAGRGARPAGDRDRLGPIRLGMPVASLRQAVAGGRDTTWTRGGSRQRGMVVPLAGGGRAVAVLSGDTVARVEVRDTLPRTREGLGVGSRLDELRAAYESLCLTAAEGELRISAPGAQGVTFAINAPAPSGAGREAPSLDVIPPSTRVTHWWLDRVDGRCQPSGGAPVR